MRMTAGELIGMMSRQGIRCSIRQGHIRLSGEDDGLLMKLREMLKCNPKLEGAIVNHLRMSAVMTAGEYLRECENVGVQLKIDTWMNVDMAGGTEKARERLRRILEGAPRLKAAVILQEALKNPDLMDMIQERACVRWSEGYSDSLFMAVMSNIASTGEIADRDERGEVKLKPRTDWDAELSSL